MLNYSEITVIMSVLGNDQNTRWALVPMETTRRGNQVFSEVITSLLNSLLMCT